MGGKIAVSRFNAQILGCRLFAKPLVEPNPIRLLLVDDHPIVRLGLKTLLERSPRIQVVGEASTAAEALTQARILEPTVVILDVRLPDGMGFDVCRELQSFPGDIRVLIFTAYADDERVLQSISAGADGYLLKEIDLDRLILSVEQIADGQSILDPAVARVVMGRVKAVGTGELRNKLELLSNQERRVLALVAQGKTNKEIGLDLELSDKTVKNYLSNLMDKLKLNRRSQAAAFFVEHTNRSTG